MESSNTGEDRVHVQHSPKSLDMVEKETVVAHPRLIPIIQTLGSLMADSA